MSYVPAAYLGVKKGGMCCIKTRKPGRNLVSFPLYPVCGVSTLSLGIVKDKLVMGGTGQSHFSCFVVRHVMAVQVSDPGELDSRRDDHHFATGADLKGFQQKRSGRHGLT